MRRKVYQAQYTFLWSRPYNIRIYRNQYLLINLYTYFTSFVDLLTFRVPYIFLLTITAVPNSVAAKYIITKTSFTSFFRNNTTFSVDTLLFLGADSAECTIFDKHMILLPFYIFSTGIYIFYLCIFIIHVSIYFFGDGFVPRFSIFLLFIPITLFIVDSQWVQSIYEVAFAYCFLQTSRIIGVYTYVDCRYIQMLLDIGLNPRVLIFIIFFCLFYFSK